MHFTRLLSADPWPFCTVGTVRPWPRPRIGPVPVPSVRQTPWPGGSGGPGSFARHAPSFGIAPVAVTDQDPFPTSDQGFKGDPGAIGVDHEQGDHRIGHHPEPIELAAAFPWGFNRHD